VNFNARFSGKPMDVMFPVNAVLAIYAKENGQGMVFGDGETEPTPPKPDKPNLRIVK
jgi:stringent starvation protein B